MPNHPKASFFELEVENFGPIEKGKVQLRPLTVLVGPSNTGKSYLAMLVYAFHRFFTDYEQGFASLLENLIHKPQDASSFGNLVGEAQQIYEAIETNESISEPTSISIPREASELIRQYYGSLGKALGIEIQRCFGFNSVNQLIRKSSGDSARAVLRSRTVETLNPFQHKLTFSPNGSKFETLVPDDLQFQIDINQMEEILEFMDYSDIRFNDRFAPHTQLYFCAVLSLAIEQLAGQFNTSAFYLPADRTSAMHAHSLAWSSLLDNSALTGLQPVAETPVFSGVVSDFLRQIIRIQSGKYETFDKVLQSLGNGIEESVLDGEVNISESTDIDCPRFTFKPKGWSRDLPLMSASSMVSELAPVVLFLRNVVYPGSTLIIEEPESHLHPEKQVELTRQFAKMVNSGINVILTTHSEWMLEELANIVRRSEIADPSQSNSADESICLHPDQVGTWQFQSNGNRNGSTITEIKQDDSGLYPTDFDDVAIALHNDWVDISNEIDNSL